MNRLQRARRELRAARRSGRDDDPLYAPLSTIGNHDLGLLLGMSHRSVEWDESRLRTAFARRASLDWRRIATFVSHSLRLRLQRRDELLAEFRRRQR